MPGFFEQGGFTAQFERAPRASYPMGPTDFGNTQRAAESSSKRSVSMTAPHNPRVISLNLVT